MDTSLSERKFEILYGPNRDLLFDACKYAFCGITHESDTGYVFCLKGTCEADIHPGDWNHLQYKGYAFEAHYDTRSRKGTIQFFSSI